MEKVARSVASGSHRVIAGHGELDRALEDEDGGTRGEGEEGERRERRRPRRMGEGRWGGTGAVTLM